MIDRTTKILLGLIALALFLNAAGPLVQPEVVNAQSSSQYSDFLRLLNSVVRCPEFDRNRGTGIPNRGAQCYISAR